MGLISVIVALPLHIKAILIAVIAMIGAWMFITPMYLEIISWVAFPSWIWMIIGLAVIMFAARFGKVIL